ncbi:MAG: hypothetical protein M1834_007278 [Cirrosporium novae-zelandiae]|nr:MAG: hypothetical protein M1834_007278 [Cirrosporium novae-zelandiae]
MAVEIDLMTYEDIPAAAKSSGFILIARKHFSIARNAHSLKLRCEWGIRNAVFHVARDPETKGLLGVAMWLPPTPASTPQTWSSYLSGWSLWVNQGLTNLRFGHGGLDVHRYWIWKSCQSECQRDIWTDPNGYWFCNIVVVQPGEQGKGVGKKLFEQVTKQADKEGRKCYLESSRDIPNTAIYERLGFKKVREMKCVDERDGVGCQLYCMVREPKRSGADDTQQAST